MSMKMKIALGTVAILLALVIFESRRISNVMKVKVEVVKTAVNLMRPAQSATEILCQEHRLKASMSHENAGLEPARRYSNQWVKRVTLETLSESTARVTVEFARHGDAISDGVTLIGDGVCEDGKMSWTVSGTLPRIYRPRKLK